jgi:hypothetical protein
MFRREREGECEEGIRENAGKEVAVLPVKL